MIMPILLGVLFLAIFTKELAAADAKDKPKPEKRKGYIIRLEEDA